METTLRARSTAVVGVLLFVSLLKLITEIALMALLGQWLLGLLAGAKRDTNFFYRLLRTIGIDELANS